MQPPNTHRETVDGQPGCCAFHPSEQRLYVATCDGVASCYDVGSAQDHLLPAYQWSHQLASSRMPCRALDVSPDGTTLATGLSSGCMVLIDAQQPRETHRLNAAGSGEQELHCMRMLDSSCVAAGLDNGAVEIWDARTTTAKPAQHHDKQEDYISDLLYISGRHTLLATAGDGSLAAYDVRKAGKCKAVSEADEDERLCLAAVKSGSKVVSGTQGGVLELWSWGCWADCSDR